MKLLKKILPICMMTTIGATITPIMTSCNDPDVPVPVVGQEACIMDNGVKHEITNLVESHVCDTSYVYEGDGKDIVCDDGKIYPRGGFNLPIYLNDNITTIPDGFLSQCSMFNQTIKLPNNLRVLGNGFLFGCNLFNKPLEIPNNTTTICDEFLHFCYSFNSELTLPNNLTFIGDNFLGRCENFNKNLVLPSHLKEIGSNFMRLCSAFKYDLIIPASVEKIVSINLPNTYTKKVSFAENSHLWSFPNYNERTFYDFSGSSLEVKNNVLYNNNTKATLWADGDQENDIELPDDCEIIGDGFLSFGDFNNDIFIPDSVKWIGDDFMYDCSSFAQSIDLPEGLLGIGNNFMSDCYSFNQNITLPNTLTSVGSSFMYGCWNMTSTLNIQNLQPNIFCQSFNTLSTDEDDDPMYTNGVTIAGANKEAFLLRFPTLQGEKEYNGNYRKLKLPIN